MQHVQTGDLNNDFRTCLAQLMEHGLIAHPRKETAMGTTRELLNYNITLMNARNRVITFPERKTNTKYLLGEFIWYLAATNDPVGILPYSKFWGNIRNTGVNPSYRAGTINSNYGFRLFGGDPMVDEQPATTVMGVLVRGSNQWQNVINILTKDKASRQAIANIHMPSDRHEGNKDVPCTLTLQFLIREEKLHLIVNMRSNDVILGFTNDVFQFTMLQECMAVQLKEVYPELELGIYFHNAGSMHIYDRHFPMAEEIIKNERAIDISMIPMDRFDQNIIDSLIALEHAWQDSGADEEADLSTLPGWWDLSPYWQTACSALFLKDEAALHKLFGQA